MPSLKVRQPPMPQRRGPPISRRRSAAHPAWAGRRPAPRRCRAPQDKKGLKAAAATNVHIAVNMLEEALPAFGSESAEGGKILAALKSLSSMVAKRDTSDLQEVPAEILQMVRRMPQMGGWNPGPTADPETDARPETTRPGRMRNV